MTATAIEEAMEDSLPEGFRNTYLEGSRLRRLSRHDISELSDTVEEYNDNLLTESDMIENVAQRILTSFLTPERTIELPGLALALKEDLLFKWAVGYKNDNDTPSGTINNVERAGVDDIVFSPLTPEIFKQITDNDDLSPNYISEGVTAGDTLEVVGDAGHDTATNTNGESLSIGVSEQVFLTGDFIDLSEGQSVVTATQYNDIDGRGFGPSDALLQSRLSGAHILTTQGTFATDTLDLDGKVYADGDAELVPVGFYLGPGRNVPDLV